MEARQPSIWCKLTPNPIEFTFLLDKETLAYATMLFMFTGLFLHWMYTKARPVYLLDFHCFKPPDRMKVPTALFMRKTAKVGVFTEESFDFQSKMLAKGGLGESTYLPYDMCSLDAPPTALNMQSARDEAELVMFTCVGKVLQENSLSANQPLRAHTLTGCYDHQSLQDAARHHRLQPLWHGLLSGNHCHSTSTRASPDISFGQLPGHVYREYHSKLVFWKPAQHADPQLPLSRRRGCNVTVE